MSFYYGIVGHNHTSDLDFFFSFLDVEYTYFLVIDERGFVCVFHVGTAYIFPKRIVYFCHIFSVLFYFSALQ